MGGHIEYCAGGLVQPQKDVFRYRQGSKSVIYKYTKSGNQKGANTKKMGEPNTINLQRYYPEILQIKKIRESDEQIQMEMKSRKRIEKCPKCGEGGNKRHDQTIHQAFSYYCYVDLSCRCHIIPLFSPFCN